MKDRLTAATIRAIEERRGVQGLSLRGIAKEAGCSHVNIYHYAPRGLADLLWLAYTVAIEWYARSCFARVADRKPGEGYGEALARGVLAFATEREGLYRLLWFESLAGEPTGEALASIRRAQASFMETTAAELAAEGLAGGLEAFGASLEILFAYLQGEIALLINGRSGPDRTSAAEAIAARSGRTWRILIEEARPRGEPGRSPV
jgi:AcrR family transcriptional regulator